MKLRPAVLAALLSVSVLAQEKDPAAPHDHSAMNSSLATMNRAGGYLMTMNSGTSLAPKSWPMPMLMTNLGSWNMNFMGQGFLVDTQQGGPRGGDKLYAPNWIMASAIHRLGSGSFMLQTMLSLDPVTVTNQRYPLLFQTGETAHGMPLVDAQHPHDFFMGIGVHYARPLGENTMLQLFYAPVGDPALGPVAFSHRASALELPQATLSHHMQDSTHIATNVATMSIGYKRLRLEASGFYGTEPDENRWALEWGPMNSYSGRLSIFPASNWMAQFSAGRLTHPEHDHPGDVIRTTASLHYTRPMSRGNAWSTSLIWGRNHIQAENQNLNSYLLETLYPLTAKDFLTGRIEVADKNELFEDGSTFRVQSYTVGYTRDVQLFRDVQTGIGANATTYGTPSALNASYGHHPWGASVFLRVRLRKDQ